ncbi:hypothetical protein SEPCBS119000_000939 [Sporothrix epigloea]|uniref:Uncharacterized protein n=1 Tax=Sporothrix epigloea TaxID=1892477 RepID=A0ABP0D7Z3_9PEZI
MRLSIGSLKALAVMLLTSISDSSASTEAKQRDGLIGRRGASAFLNFFFHRIIRCGPRLLVYPFFLLASLFILIRYLPTDLPDSIASGTKHLWSFRPGVKGGHRSGASLHPSDNNAHDAVVGGGLRIVVFGENDVATSMLPDAGASPKQPINGTSWTRELCIEQLGCTTYLSYIPELDTPRRSLSSNALYGMFTDEVLRDSKDKNAADDFSFVSKDYPNSLETPDLYTQVNRFLGQPAPERAPKETIFVFTPGMWDVWSLAAFPDNKAQSYLMSLVFDLFMIIEMLYDAAHNTKSIAYSNYSLSPLETKAAKPTASTLASRSSSDSKLGWEDEAAQPFRVVVPLLFDPSLVPGWKLDRPSLPAQHTKSEQMRNAVRLTKIWNDHVADEMDKWIKKNTTFISPEDRARLAAEKAAASLAADTKKETRDETTTLPVTPTTQRRDGNDNGSNNDDSSGRATSPVLLRDGVVFRMADYLMDMIIDSQMQTQGLADSKGFGKLSKADRFLEVSKPCVVPESAGPLANQLQPAAEFRFESGDQEKKSKEKAEAEKKKADSKPPRRIKSKRAEKQGSEETAATEGVSSANSTLPVEAATPSSSSPAEKMLVCANPDSHLFYTSFSLGQRATEEVGRIAAAVLRANPNKRSAWEIDRRARFESDRAPASWEKYFDRR